MVFSESFPVGLGFVDEVVLEMEECRLRVAEGSTVGLYDVFEGSD